MDAPIHFEGTKGFLDGFNRDTGWVPSSPPAQVKIAVHGGGSIKASATGSMKNGELTPVAGSGSLKTEGSVTLDVFAKVDVSGQKWEGLVKTVTYEVTPGTTTFEPFLSSATVKTALPPTKLGDFPLGGVPGTVTLKIEGGTLDTELTGTCAKAASSHAQFAARLSTSGTIKMSATLTVGAGPLKKTFDPIPFDVPVPAIPSELDLGTFDSATAMRVTSAPFPCAGATNLDGGTGGAGGGSGTAGGNAGTAGGNAGTAGGNAGTAGGNAGTAGGNAGTAGGNAGTAGGNAGTAGGNAGTAGGNAPTWSLGAGTVALTAHGGSGGAVVTLACPQGAALIGYNQYVESTVHYLAPVCQQVTEIPLGTSNRFTTGVAGTVPQNATATFDSCPTGYVAVGFIGRSGSELDQISLRCAPMASWLTSSANVSSTPSRGGSGGSPFFDSCPVAYVLDSLTVRSGARIDSITGRCRLLVRQ